MIDLNPCILGLWPDGLCPNYHEPMFIICLRHIVPFFLVLFCSVGASITWPTTRCPYRMGDENKAICSSSCLIGKWWSMLADADPPLGAPKQSVLSWSNPCLEGWCEVRKFETLSLTVVRIVKQSQKSLCAMRISQGMDLFGYPRTTVAMRPRFVRVCLF
jgi:hypothetical protein